jgi:hypothetical protein
MIPLILKHGFNVVKDAGIKYLGYPGTWITTDSECIGIEMYLKEDNYGRRQAGNGPM